MTKKYVIYTKQLIAPCFHLLAKQRRTIFSVIFVFFFASACPTYTVQCSIDDIGDNPNQLDGALVSGPDENDNYNDDRTDVVHNDVSIDYNAGLQGALAGKCKWCFPVKQGYSKIQPDFDCLRVIFFLLKQTLNL